MNVSMYEAEIRKAFSDTLDEIEKEPFEATVKKVVDRLAEDVVGRVHDDVRDRLVMAIGDSVCAKAAEVATRMLESALAGDETELRNLFGFYEHAEGSLAWRVNWHPRPDRWQLIEALMERRPDIFVSEKIDEANERAIHHEREAQRMRKQADWWRAKAEGREPGGHP